MNVSELDQSTWRAMVQFLERLLFDGLECLFDRSRVVRQSELMQT